MFTYKYKQILTNDTFKKTKSKRLARLGYMLYFCG